MIKHVMKDFQQRVVKEKEELDDKLSRLKPFLDSETFESLPLEEQERLVRQHDLMQQYSSILGERIEAFV